MYFAKQFYDMIAKEDQDPYVMLDDVTTYTTGSGGDPASQVSVVGRDKINLDLEMSVFRGKSVYLVSVDAQDTFDEGLIVLVQGAAVDENNAENSRSFVQTFLLGKDVDEGVFFLRNTVIRFLTKDPVAAAATTASQTEAAAAPPATSAPETPAAAPTPAKTEEPPQAVPKAAVAATAAKESAPAKKVVPEKRAASQEKKKGKKKEAAASKEATRSNSNDNNAVEAAPAKSEEKKAPSSFLDAARRPAKENGHPVASAATSGAPPKREKKKETNDKKKEKEGRRNRKGGEDKGGILPNAQCYVSNIAFTTTDEDLTRLLSRFGKVKQIVRPPSRGYGFVEYYDDRDAKKAIKNTARIDLNLDGRELKIEEKTGQTNSGKEKDKRREKKH